MGISYIATGRVILFEEVKMRRKCIAIPIFFYLLFIFATLALAQSGLPGYKQTKIGLYVTAKDAFEKWNDSSEEVVILDVRDPAEYLFVGHAPMARNIPFKLFSAEKTAQKRKLAMETNPNFIAEVKKRYQVTDTILIMCRSGGRSAEAANLLAKEGFKKVYTITDGFEGDRKLLTRRRFCLRREVFS